MERKNPLSPLRRAKAAQAVFACHLFKTGGDSTDPVFEELLGSVLVTAQLCILQGSFMGSTTTKSVPFETVREKEGDFRSLEQKNPKRWHECVGAAKYIAGSPITFPLEEGLARIFEVLKEVVPEFEFLDADLLWRWWRLKHAP